MKLLNTRKEWGFDFLYIEKKHRKKMYYLYFLNLRSICIGLHLNLNNLIEKNE